MEDEKRSCTMGARCRKMDRYWDYLISLGPIVIPCLLVRPQDLSGLPYWYQEHLENSPALLHDITFLNEHFLFNRQRWEKGKYWTALTYMFYHRDVAHVMGNLANLMSSGSPVYCKFGAGGLYAIFFGSGIFAALDSQKKDQQTSMWIMNHFKNPFPSSWTQLSALFDQGSSRFSSLVTPYVTPFMYYAGCSAGNYGVMAASMCVSVEVFLRTLYRIIFKGEAASILLSVATLNGVACASQCYQEYRRFQRGGSAGVDRAGHVSGIVFGLGCYASFSLIKWGYNVRKRMSKSSRNNSRILR